MGKTKRKLKYGTRNRAKKNVSVGPATPWGGDHGTGTLAATANTEIVELKDEKGRNPNRMAYRRRINVLDTMADKLSMRQMQAAQEIQDAYSRVQMLSSGSPLKEQVDASPKPDAVIAGQVDAISRLKRAMDAVPNAMRDVIEGVCWHNQTIRHISGGGRKQYNRMADFKVALDLVANRLRY